MIFRTLKCTSLDFRTHDVLSSRTALEIPARKTTNHFDLTSAVIIITIGELQCITIRPSLFTRMCPVDINGSFDA